MDEFLQDFLKDAREDLQKVESSLVLLENKISNQEDFDYDLVNNLFRYFHSIKGSAGFFKLKEVVRVSHEAENILDLYRKKVLEIKEVNLNSIFKVHDFLDLLIGGIEKNGNDRGLEDRADEIIKELKNIAESSKQESSPIVREKKFGIFEQSSLSEEIQDDQSLHIEKNDPIETIAEDRENQKLKSSKYGIFETDEPSKKSQVNIESSVFEANQEKKSEHSDIRIPTAKLDQLVNYLGELVIIEAMVSRHANDEILNIEMLRRSTSHLSKITRDLQEIGLSMRMVPLAGLFQKMTRLVRDVSKKAKKNIHLEIHGEETEIDKSIIEQLSNPLVHILRNAIDHGIEDEETRLKNQKNPIGNIRLEAKHKGGEIWILISDDGKGLDREKILKKAKEEKLIEDIEKELTDEEIFNFIFLPGFSTAKEVTDISGRGVGMDVVKKEISRLKGRIEIHSKNLEGTTFLLRIPLTLAIIDSMVVKYSGRYYIIPTEHIERFIDLNSMNVFEIHDRQKVINLNDQLISVVELTDIFQYSKIEKEHDAKIAVIIGKKNQFVAVKLDEIIGSQQIVVKPLDESMEFLKGLTGSGILGDGEVGMILDAEYIVRMYMTTDEEVTKKAQE